ncbi:MAG: hypothetical protein PF487_04550, partial [Bacteroidales bacterium]|nr:hypothetical protein [Bacteroidales bacterium]
YTLYEGIFQKIEIIERKFTERNNNHIDAAIGEIDVNNYTDYFNPKEFEDVTSGMELTLIGYSRHLNNDVILNEKETILISKLQKLNSFCFDINYDFSNEHIPMSNSFSFILDNKNLGGLSGSPIFNKKNRIIGIFKGGAQINTKIKCQAIHIKIITKMYNESLK